MTSFQQRAGYQGRTYEDAVADQLARFGWFITARNWIEPTSLVEVDIVAADRDGRIWWIECKGSWESKSNRNGLERTDTTKKLIANAALLWQAVPDRPAYMVVTSDEPTNAGQRWLQIALDAGWLTKVERLRVL